MEVLTIDMLHIGIKFENFMQAGCRDQGLHRGRTVYCQKPISLPKLVLFSGTFSELPVLSSIIYGFKFNGYKNYVANQDNEKIG